jgi:hypothetical protein
MELDDGSLTLTVVVLQGPGVTDSRCSVAKGEGMSFEICLHCLPK